MVAIGLDGSSQHEGAAGFEDDGVEQLVEHAGFLLILRVSSRCMGEELQELRVQVARHQEEDEAQAFHQNGQQQHTQSDVVHELEAARLDDQYFAGASFGGFPAEGGRELEEQHQTHHSSKQVGDGSSQAIWVKTSYSSKSESAGGAVCFRRAHRSNKSVRVAPTSRCCWRKCLTPSRQRLGGDFIQNVLR